MDINPQILKVENLKKFYPIKKAFEKPALVQALRGLSFTLSKGETLAIVGESGCGKSTLAKVLLQLEEITEGRAEIFDRDLTSLNRQELSNFVQMVFQDPSSSLNRRKKVFDLIAEPLVIQKSCSNEDLRKRVLAAAQSCGVPVEFLERYPHMMSGGQRQRVGIARALVTEPQILILDEPVSALDVSVQAQVLNLLLDLRRDRKLSYLFISHDLSVVQLIAHRVAVLYLGKIVEIGSKQDIFENPMHPYTQLLLQSAPKVFSPSTTPASQFSELPSPLNPPPGCGFAGRCPFVMDICRRLDPELKEQNRRRVACHLVEKSI